MPKAQAQKTTSAEKRAAARDAYTKGKEAFDAEDFETAAESFKRADSNLPSPHAKYWIAASLDKAGKTDEAIAAYDTFLDDPGAARVGEDRVVEARNRVKALKAAAAEAMLIPDEPGAETGPAEEPAASDLDIDLGLAAEGAGEFADQEESEAAAPSGAPRPFMQKLKPEARMAEVGLFGGMLFLASDHNLQHGERVPHLGYSAPSPLFGIRTAYFPLTFLGFEGEFGYSAASVDAPDGKTAASIFPYHLQLVGQLPSWRLVPFVVFGLGCVAADSVELGSDTDVALRVGIGAKLAVSRRFLLRLDIADDMTERQGGGLGDGITSHPQLLLGVSVALGRSADGD